MAQARTAGRFAAQILKAITTPLGFYVLALLIIEGTLGLVLTFSKLAADRVWDGFVLMIVLFGAVVAIVTVLTVFSPKRLLYGKEEHSTEALKPSALRDQIEDLIARNVKPECLNFAD